VAASIEANAAIVMVRMIGIPRIFATAAFDALPRESCILIKLRFVLLHRRKKAPLRLDFGPLCYVG
jgi:hypothetical protein